MSEEMSVDQMSIQNRLNDLELQVFIPTLGDPLAQRGLGEKFRELHKLVEDLERQLKDLKGALK